MPRIPKWLGDTMETVFSKMIHPVTVSSVEYLAPTLKKVVMAGDFTGVKFNPGKVIEFRINPTTFRHYTISRFDQEKGICEMLIYLHGNTEGCRWADELKAGDQLKLMGPGGKISYDDSRDHHFFFGDETSLGLFVCLKEEALRKGHRYYCLAELEQSCSGWPSLAGVSAQVVDKSFDTPAAPTCEKISAFDPPFWKQWQEATFYLTGRAKSIQAVRKILRSQGISMKQIRTEPYWAEGKKGL